MATSIWQAAGDILQSAFHIFTVIFTATLFVDAFTHGLINVKYVNLDYALVTVLFFGAILVLLELVKTGANDSLLRQGSKRTKFTHSNK